MKLPFFSSKTASSFPPGVAVANTFDLYNYLSLQIFTGQLIVLFAKNLGASATLLGLLSAFPTLLSLLQIPSARYLKEMGYRRFSLIGWKMRIGCIFFSALLPWATFLTDSWKLALLVGAVFLYNLLRCINAGVWMSWLAELLPQALQARFLSRDHRFSQIGGLAALFICSLFLQENFLGKCGKVLQQWAPSLPLPRYEWIRSLFAQESIQPWQFSLVLVISALTGIIALLYLRRVPDARAHGGDGESAGTRRIPWETILTHGPFVRLLGFNLLNVVAIGSLGVFTVTFLKEIGESESRILFWFAISPVASVLMVEQLRRFLERFGGKALLMTGMLLYCAYIAGWALMALKIVAPTNAVLFVLLFLGGISGSGFNLANAKLMMITAPKVDREHFYAFFTVVSCLFAGLVPILWGAVLDGMAGVNILSCGLHWNQYSIYFVISVIFGLVCALYVPLLSSQPAEEEEPVPAQLP